MSLRICNCSGGDGEHKIVVAPAQPLPPYIPPTRALILHLTNFPMATTGDFASQPHLNQLRSRSTDMTLKWQEDAAAGYAAAQQAHADTQLRRSERAVSSVLRILGIDATEQDASFIRSQLLQQARVDSGVIASPAAAYPPPYGRARIELASNHLGVHETAKTRFETLRHTRAVNNVTQCVFLQPQVAMQPSNASLDDITSPFLVDSRPPLQSHSSIPLVKSDQRDRYIQAVVKHVAQRLQYKLAGTCVSSICPTSISTDEHPHIFLLHIDAHALLGAPRSSDEERTFNVDAGRFADQLLAALLTQMEDIPAAPKSAATPSSAASSYPPPLPQLSDLPWLPPMMLPDTSIHLSTPVRAAASVLGTLAHRCPHLMWSVIRDLDATDTNGSSNSTFPVAPIPQQQLLAALRPIQSYQVQDGIVDTRKEGFVQQHGTAH